VAFPNRLLADNEKLVFDLKPHPIELLLPVFWTAVLAILAWLAYQIVEGHPATHQAILVVAIVLWIWLAVVPFLRWAYTDFVLTTDRLITRSGVLAKHSKEIPLERINDVTFNQSVFERMVGAGSLVIESAGERGQETIRHVRKPEEVQLMIYKETEGNAGRAASAATPAPAPDASIPDQIEALARLRQHGAISEAEYETKKAELLGRM
jgi:uncharacterized membrane protein YdbT with pleckstrin-like domain